MMGEFRSRRDYLVPALNAIPGLSCRLPGGAFYAFPKVSGLGVPAEYSQYARMDLESQPLVVITPTRVTGWGIYRH